MRSGDAVCLVRSFYSAVSSGSERLVLAGRVPPDLHPAMRVPYMAGDFPFPVKYGYSLVGRVEQGPRDLLGRIVHLMHPHQDLCTVKVADVFPVPDDVPPARAPLASNLETAVTAVWDARPALGERVLVVGFGYIGALIGQLLRGMPGIDLRILEVDELRMQCALEIGYELAEPGGAEFDLAFHTSGRRPDCRKRRPSAWKAAWSKSGYGTAETTLRLGGSFHQAQNHHCQPGVDPSCSSDTSDPPLPPSNWSSLPRDPRSIVCSRFDSFEQVPEFFNCPLADRAQRTIGGVQMNKVLLVSSANHPIVTNGCESWCWITSGRPLQSDVHFVATKPELGNPERGIGITPAPA